MYEHGVGKYSPSYHALQRFLPLDIVTRFASCNLALRELFFLFCLVGWHRTPIIFIESVPSCCGGVTHSVQSSPGDMLPSPMRIESTITGANHSGLPGRPRYLWDDIPASRTENRNMGISLEMPLPYARPEKLDESLLPAPRDPVSCTVSTGTTQEQNKDEGGNAHDIYSGRNGSTIAHDERRENVGLETSPVETKAEKRKMKRFR